MGNGRIRNLGSVITFMEQGAKLWKDKKQYSLVMPSGESYPIDGRVGSSLTKRRSDLVTKTFSDATGERYELTSAGSGDTKDTAIAPS